MEKLFLSTHDQYFTIESEFTILDNLRISKGNKEKEFESVSKNKWRIAAHDVAELLTLGQEDRAAIYYSSEMKEITVENFELSVDSSLMIEVKNTVLYLYITLDNNLKFIWNQEPSARAFLEDWAIQSLEKGNNKDIQVSLKLDSKYIQLSKVFLVIKNRKENILSEIEMKSISINKVNDNLYRNIASFNFDIQSILQDIHPNMIYDTFDTTILDFFVRIEVEQLLVTDYKFRLKFPECKTVSIEEMWLDYSDHMKVLFNWYPTLHGMFSSKLGFLKNEEYEIFIKKEQQPVSKDEKLILITEYPHKAQDNGRFFFEYLMTKQSKYKPYFIITKDSKDITNLEPFMENVVIFKSKKHIELLFKASYIAHTHTSNYALPFLSKSTERMKSSMKKVFLQHGIIAIKNVDFVYSKVTNPSLTDKFLVSSEREKQQVMKQLSYEENEVAVTGLARFDSLLNGNSFFKSFSLRKNVLIMPTWRKGQDFLTDQEFMETDFYQYYFELLNDDQFLSLIKKFNLNVRLYLHNNFQKYNHLFSSESIEIIEAGTKDVQELLKEHGILITDYSSVGLDFALQKRSVIYYQFDQDKEEVSEGASENKDLLPGPVFTSKKELIPFIEKKIKFNILEKQYKKTLKENIFPYDDKHSCDRIYAVLEQLDN